MRKLYRLLLHLFPEKYREEFRDELQAVFNLSLAEAQRSGKLAVVDVWLRELIGLPGAVIYEHLRERSYANMLNRLGSYFDFSYGSWKEYLTALFPFLLVGCIWPGVNMLTRLSILTLPATTTTIFFLSLLGLLLLLFMMGMTIGMPRWSLPYLGFILSFLSVYLFSAIIGLFIILPFGKLYARVEFLGDVVYSGIFWFGLLLAAILLVVMTRFFPAFQAFRLDWTLGCFAVYGAVPFAVVLSFDEYANDEPFILLIFLVLATGAWLYLRTNDERKRFWTLSGALTISMFIVAAGKAILLPSQTWPFTITSSLAISEVKGTVFTWVWLALCMLVPLGIKFVPRLDGLSEGSLSGG